MKLMPSKFNVEELNISAQEIEAHASAFADHLLSNSGSIHQVLRKYQSKEVIEDEIKRSIETLKGIKENSQYFKI